MYDVGLCIPVYNSLTLKTRFPRYLVGRPVITASGRNTRINHNFQNLRKGKHCHHS